MNPRRLLALVLALAASLVLAAACTGKKSERRTLTERERDSTIGASQYLPGAEVTKRSLSISDSVKARAARLDAEVEAGER